MSHISPGQTPALVIFLGSRPAKQSGLNGPIRRRGTLHRLPNRMSMVAPKQKGAGRAADKRAFLGSHPIFGALGPDLVDQLTSYAIPRSVKSAAAASIAFSRSR